MTRRAAAGATGHGDLGASLVLIFPALLAYELGVLFVGRVNGADVVTRAVYEMVGGGTPYIVLYTTIAIGFLLWIRSSGRSGTLRLEVAAPVILEAAIYALTLGAVANVIIERLLGLGAGGALVSALGAGVHEELVFRLGVMTALIAVLDRPGLDRRLAVTLALLGSAVLFAAAHHVGPHGEPWSRHAFAFRCIAGVAFGAIYWHRSLAHAVYAHVLYDILVAIT